MDLATTIKGILMREGVLVPSHYCVIRVGASAPSLEKFVSDGHIVVGHNWDELGVGYITSAELGEQNTVLFSGQLYENCKAADDLALVMGQRADQGKQNALSAGFFCAGYGFESGAAMLGWLAEQGDDLAQYDTAAIAAVTDWLYLITEIDYIEVSSVLDGAVDDSLVLEISQTGKPLEGFDREGLGGKLAAWRAMTKKHVGGNCDESRN